MLKNNFSQLGEVTQVSKVISILQLDPEHRTEEEIDLIINQVEVSASLIDLTFTGKQIPKSVQRHEETYRDLQTHVNRVFQGKTERSS